MEAVKNILRQIQQGGCFSPIKRYSYLPYDINVAMQVVEGIGKTRNPNFVIDNENRFTYENLIRWVQGDKTMMCLDPETKQPVQGRLDKGIYIAGNTGTGKSWALEIMTVYSMIDDIQVCYGKDFNGKNINGCLRWKNVRTDTMCEEYIKEGSYDRFKSIKILGIQDLGAEPSESLYMGNRVDVLRMILEYRGDQEGCMTLITSNLPINHQKLIDRYGDRVASRLAEMCNYFEIRGTDRRRVRNYANKATNVDEASKAPSGDCS